METGAFNQQRISNISGRTKSSCKNRRLTKEDGQRSLLRFIGSFRPICGNHSLLEAGGSAFLPQTVLLVYRLLSTCGFVFTLVLFTATGDFQFTRYGEWLYLGSGLATCLALFSSLCFLLCSELSETEGRCDCRPLYILANLTVPIFQIFLTLTLVADILFWSLLREPFDTIPQLLLYAVSAAVMLVDYALASMMKFRVSYVLFAVAIPTLWLVFAWIRFAVLRSWMYESLDLKGGDVARAVLLHVLFFTAPVLLGLILLCANRFQSGFLITRSQTHVMEKDRNSESQSDDWIPEKNDGLYMDLASVTANSSSFISLSAPLPMYQVCGREAVPVARNTRQIEHSSEEV